MAIQEQISVYELELRKIISFIIVRRSVEILAQQMELTPWMMDNHSQINLAIFRLEGKHNILEICNPQTDILAREL